MRPTASRRRFLALAAAGCGAGLAGCSESEDGPAETATAPDASGTTAGDDAGLPASVGLETLATGLEVPLDVAFAPAADRRYVADQRGRAFVHEGGGLRETPFLDLRDRIVGGSEAGLLGLALHPGFADNRRLFVRYSAPLRSGMPDGYSHTFVLSEFRATDDGTSVAPDSERVLLEIAEPQGNHNAGSVAFGPDGYLYVGVGDGGSGGDRGTGHVDDWYDGNAGGNGQDVTENLLGSMLRIDVDDREDRPYAVPEDNPLVGEDGLDEHYAWGFRNPWRISFDDGRLFVADVGQSGYEEVSIVEKGGNYGWNVEEGTHCYATDDCPDRTPAGVRGGEPLVAPVVEYPHSEAAVSGVSVIGGHVYRGSALPGLAGAYVFADLAADGRLFAATPDDGDGTWPVEVVEMAGDGLDRVYSFGRDADGELYVLGTESGDGGLYRVVPAG